MFPLSAEQQGKELRTFIKIYREGWFFKAPFNDAPNRCWPWVRILLAADYKEGLLEFKIRDMARHFGIAHRTFDDFLKDLEKHGCIKLETSRKGTRLTITNWDWYQNELPAQMAERKKAPNPPAESAAGGEEKPKRSASGSYGTRLPENWPQSPEAAECANWASREFKWSQSQIDTALHEFADYWHAVPGQRGRKTDWVATWRNNVRKKEEFRANRPKTAKERREESYRAAFRDIEEAERQQRADGTAGQNGVQQGGDDDFYRL